MCVGGVVQTTNISVGDEEINLVLSPADRYCRTETEKLDLLKTASSSKASASNVVNSVGHPSAEAVEQSNVVFVISTPPPTDSIQKIARPMKLIHAEYCTCNARLPQEEDTTLFIAIGALQAALSAMTAFLDGKSTVKKFTRILDPISPYPAVREMDSEKGKREDWIKAFEKRYS